MLARAHPGQMCALGERTIGARTHRSAGAGGNHCRSRHPQDLGYTRLVGSGAFEHGAMATSLSYNPLRAGMPLPVRTEPDAPAMEVGDVGQCDRRRVLGHRITAAVLVRGTLR